MRRIVVTCPVCRVEPRLPIELDKRLLERFAEGVHVYCDECAIYRRMRPEESRKTAA